MTKHRQRPESKADLFAPYPGLALSNGPFFDVLQAAGQTYTRVCLAWQEEALRSASERLQKDEELSAALGECQNWMDVARLHQQWTLAAAQNLLSEVTRFAHLTSRLANDGWWDGARGPRPEKQSG